MGHVLDEWTAKVAQLIRSQSGKHLSALDIEDVGVRPAFADLARDRPYTVTADLVSVGTDYLPLPAGWVRGSVVTGVEYPIGDNPPTTLVSSTWVVTRDPADVDDDVLLLLDDTVPLGDAARVTYSVPAWPYPNDDEDTDQLDDVGFEAVCALAAARSLRALAAEAARNLAASLPTDFMGGTDRVRDLMQVADGYEATYRRLLGLDSATSPERKRVGTIRLTVPT